MRRLTIFMSALVWCFFCALLAAVPPGVIAAEEDETAEQADFKTQSDEQPMQSDPAAGPDGGAVEAEPTRTPADYGSEENAKGDDTAGEGPIEAGEERSSKKGKPPDETSTLGIEKMSFQDLIWIVVLAVIATAIVVAGIAYWLASRRRPAAESIQIPQPSREYPDTDSVGVSMPESDAPLTSDPKRSVRISRLELTNIRSFSSLDLAFSRSQNDTGEGNWILLLGDNGVGKSTILRSIVLALVDPDVATALLQTQESSVPYIRRGEECGEIKLTLNDEFKYQVEFRPGAGAERFSTKSSPQYRPDIFAYGPQRGSAVGGTSRTVAFSAVAPVETLFTESAELVHAATWLQQRQLSALQSRGGAEEAFFESVIASLQELLPGVDSIDVTGEGVVVTGAEVGDRVPLAGMSDGYLGLIGWVLDFVARWTNRYERTNGESVGGSMANKARALIAVDEIGLHLHPSWQIIIIEELRKKFPNVTFVGTSHHPLTLIGAKKGEVYVLRRDDETKQVGIELADVPPGITADQILTGRWFNLPSTLDEDTRSLIQQHADLLRQGAAEGDERIRSLEHQLRMRLGSFADTSIDKMALQVAAEVMRDKESSFENLSPKRREEIRQEMLADLENRVKQKN